MSDLGNLYFSVMLKDMTDADIDKIKKKLEKVGVKVGAEVNRQTLERSIRDMLKHKTFDVNLDVNKNNKKASIEVNKSILTKSVTDALKGQTFSADLKLVIRNATVQDAIRQAFAQAGMKYNTTASDVRAQRIAEIQQRMAIRAANAQRNLGNAHRYAASGAHESTRASVTFGKSLYTNIRLAGELGTTLGNFASVFGLKDILQKVVEIGGQLENQRIALGSILQDGGQTAAMFEKIQSLAVKSSFGIMELNQYTKQLSAYSIPYNELYETMKRLADISAGVGVDMGRIILAFGQVKAAGFLKGTELRQFTEANIPLVDKLADRFTKLSGEIVTASDVYDMISKKKVSFGDVKSVLWDLTSEGGMFYQMQEVLSDSLIAKWKNLGDAIDVMFGKIAGGAAGNGLKLLAEGLTELTKQWDKLAVGISTVASIILLKKSAFGLLSYNLGSVRGAAVSLSRELIRLRVQTGVELASASNSFQRFSIHVKGIFLKTQATLRVFAANIKIMWTKLFASLKAAAMSFLPFAIITGITETIYYFINKSEESANRINDISKAAYEGFDNLSRKIKSIGNEIPKTTAGILSSIKDMETALRDYAPNSGDILNGINEKNENGRNKNSDIERYKILKQALDDTKEAYRLLGEEMEGFSEAANNATDGVWDESFRDNIKDASAAMQDYRKELNAMAANGFKYKDAIEAAKKADSEFAKAVEGKNLKESLDLLRNFPKAYAAFYEKSLKTVGANLSFDDAIDTLKEQQDIALQDARTFVEKYKGLLESAGFDLGNLTQAQKIAISVDVTKFFDSIEGLDDETKKLFTQRILEKEFKIKLSKEDVEEVEKLADPYDPSKDEVAKMWKKRAEEIAKAVKMYDDWKKVEGKLLAENRVKYNEELANLFNGAYGFNLDLENPTEAYEYIQSLLDESKEAQKDLKIQLRVKISDAKLKDAKDELKDFLDNTKTYIDKTIKGWELYKKIFESTGNKSLAMNLAFGGNVSFENQLEELETKIREVMKDLGIGIDFSELIKMDTKAFEDAGWNGVAELIKKYNEESRKFKQESIDNFIDIIKASKDFEQQIADIQRKLQKDLKDLRDNAAGKGMDDNELKRREDELTRKANEDISSVRFEEFKKSSDWVKVFDDLDRVSNATLDNMIAKIEAFAGNAEISQKELKELVEALSKLRKESIERNPFGGLANSISRLKELQLAQQRGLNQNGKYMVRDSTGFHREMDESDLRNAIKAAETDLVTSINGISDAFKNLEGIVDPLIKVLDAFGEGADDLAMGFSVLSDILGSASSTSKSFSGLMGLSVGKDDKGNAVSLADKLGIKNAGLWGAVAGAALGAISSIAGAHDKKLDKAIDKSKQKVKELENAYSNLEGVIEWQLGGVTSKQSKEMLDNLNQQVYELYRQRELEEEKKKTDPAKIEDYNQQIHEAEIAVRDFYANLANEQYGFEIKDWASDIAKALTDAFASGEDAAKAFDNTVSDILRSLATEAIRMQFIEPAMNNLRSFLFDPKSGIFTDNSLGGTQMTEIEADRLAEELNKLKEQIGSANDYWDAINEATGGLLDSTEDAAKGGLSKGVQGVTEDTANLLGSYLNAIRQSVAVNRGLLEQLIGSDVPKMSVIAEAQLRELNQIAVSTKRNADAADKIYDLVNRVVDKGSNKLKI